MARWQLHLGDFGYVPGTYDQSPRIGVGFNVVDHLSDLNGEGPDRAQDAYLQFLASGILSGAVRFYSEDPLATPPGFQVFSENCADVPNFATIQRNHALLVQQFGNVIRNVGKSTSCDGDVTGMLQRETVQLEGNTNAWMFQEITIIAMAAGWFEGLSHSDRGVPRPPLCN